MHEPMKTDPARVDFHHLASHVVLSEKCKRRFLLSRFLSDPSQYEKSMLSDQSYQHEQCFIHQMISPFVILHNTLSTPVIGKHHPFITLLDS